MFQFWSEPLRKKKQNKGRISFFVKICDIWTIWWQKVTFLRYLSDIDVIRTSACRSWEGCLLPYLYTMRNFLNSTTRPSRNTNWLFLFFIKREHWPLYSSIFNISSLTAKFNTYFSFSFVLIKYFKVVYYFSLKTTNIYNIYYLVEFIPNFWYLFFSNNEGKELGVHTQYDQIFLCVWDIFWNCLVY